MLNRNCITSGYAKSTNDTEDETRKSLIEACTHRKESMDFQTKIIEMIPSIQSAATTTSIFIERTEQEEESMDFQTKIIEMIPSIQSAATTTSIFSERTEQEEGLVQTEILFSDNGVSDLQNGYEICKKNPGHAHFSNIIDFDVENLAPSLIEKDFLKQLLEAMANLSVLLVVSISNDANTSRKIKIGNGFVGHMTIYTEDNNTTCHCRDCLLSNSPQKKFALIVIYTSIHVVSNEDEAKSSTCRLFYDTPDSDLVTLKDYKYCQINKNERKVKLNFVTCKKEIIDKLGNANDSRNNYYPKVNAHFKTISRERKPVLIISHIHGLHKRVSIGKWNQRFILNTEHNITQYTYDTPTCVGSAGAYVYIFSNDKKGCLEQHMHCGVYDKGHNFSGKGTDYV